MKIISKAGEMQEAANEHRLRRKVISVVPTMGYLHEGHLALIRKAREKADVVVTTIFVNPKQFAPHEDFDKYPRDPERDKELAESAGTDILFIPTTAEMYPDGYLAYVEVEKLCDTLEGRSRPSHFRGVATIVAKLFNIIRPHAAFFGQKDAQQVLVVRQMVRDLNFDTDVIVVPTVREPDGLAMSSRNMYLTSSERTDSVVLFQSISLAAGLIKGGERLPAVIISEMKKLIGTKQSARIDYISVASASDLSELSTLSAGQDVLVSGAVYFGTTRLIDNILLTI